MSKIDLSQEDYDFLKNLCHELNTQDNDGNADPVFWGVMEKYEAFVPEGCGRPKIRHDDGAWELEEAVEYVDNIIHEYEPDIQDEWRQVSKDYPDDVCDFMRERLEWDFCDVYWVEDEDRLSTHTGAFLTKRACEQYIDKYKYNHNQPHTYAMTAFRNYELTHLLKILRGIKFEGDETVEKPLSIHF